MKWILPILVMLCFGCKQEEAKPKIEIYLLKHPVASIEGIPYTESDEYRLNYREYDPLWVETARYDTINNQIVFGGRFEATSADLQDYPFIKDDEIIGFDLNRNMFIFSSVVKKRIDRMFPYGYKYQFVLTSDKTPILSGYIWTGMVSSFPRYFAIYDMDAKALYGINPQDPGTVGYILEYGPPKQWADPQMKRPAYKAGFLTAFRTSGRLIAYK